MKKPFRVVIAEDHTILREGLNVLLSSQQDLEVVSEAQDGLEAVSCVRNHSPDIILLDLSMPRMTGLDAIKEIKKVRADTKVVVLTVHDSEEYILSSLRAGADGYVLKEAHSSELLTAIRHVADGRHYLSPTISGTIIDGFLEGRKTSAVRTTWESLSKRERQILKLIAEGHKNKDIADFLCISTKTVEKHRSNLMEKLDLHNVAALTALAAEKGLINR